MNTAKEFEAQSGNLVSVEVVTEVKLLGGKKNPMLGKVTKTTTGTVTLGKRGLYKELMEAADPNWTPNDNPARKGWGERKGDGCIIEHKGGQYIELLWQDAGKPVYRLESNVIDKVDVEGLKDKVESKNETAGVFLRRIKIENITLV